MVNIHALYSSHSNNLGDYIQTFAIEQLLSGVNGFTDRENLLQETRECVLVANGWWKHFPEDFPPPSHVTPAYVGIHLAHSSLYTDKLKDHFNEHGPVGCRDVFTLERLREIGVAAYFSGCMTLGLQRWIEPNGKGEVIAVDPPPGLKLDATVKKFSHGGVHDSHPSAMREAALTLLTAYQRASMVLTTRLHVALPCLAFGTPVVLFADKRDPRMSIAAAHIPLHSMDSQSVPEPSVLKDGTRNEIYHRTRKQLFSSVSRAVERHYSRRSPAFRLSLAQSYDKDSAGREAKMIPRTVHQFASDPGSVPQLSVGCMQETREFCSRYGYHYQLWTPRAVEVFLAEREQHSILELLLHSRNYGEYADIARYAILHHLGGWWFDWDISIVHPGSLDQLLTSCRDFGFVGIVDPANDVIANELLGAEMNSTLLKTFLTKLKPAGVGTAGTPQYSGPFALTSHLHSLGKPSHRIRLLTVREVFQGSYGEVSRGRVPRASGSQPLFHHWSHSWMGSVKMHAPFYPVPTSESQSQLKTVASVSTPL